MTTEKLIKDGYKILNAKITSVDLSMADHNCLTLPITLEGEGWGCTMGNCSLGFGYIGAETFIGCEYAAEYIMRIMDVANVSHFNDLKGKYIRVAFDETDRVYAIGNIIKNKWFCSQNFLASREVKK